MQVLRIFTDEEGQSHFDSVNWRLTDQRYCDSPPGYTITEAVDAKEVRLIHTPAGFVDDWHPVPDPMISVLLNGQLKMDVGDGESRMLNAGEFVICSDPWGKGHCMNETSGAAYDMLLLILNAPFDPVQ